MSEYKTVEFGSLKVGDEFECYGDYYLNYNYPKICKCIKTEDTMGTEVDGINFGMNKSDKVFVVV